MRAKTLKELASRLDVSITTVSRALAGHEQIAEKTRERVVKAARELGYVPNRAARQLVSGRSGFVCMALPIRGPNFVDSYFGDFVMGLGEGLVADGVDLFLAAAQPGQTELQVLRHVVEAGQADGIVLTRIGEEDERVAYLKARNFPFVAHGRLKAEATSYSWLDADSETAFAEAFELLYGLGHRHFGLVSISEPQTFKHLREMGLEGAIARRGDPDVKLEIARAPRFDRDKTQAAITDLLSRDPRPTTIIGLFDELALRVMEEAGRMGLSIPEDLSVVGFDNIAASAYAPPGLTTFEADTRAAARQMAHMIVSIIDRPDQEPLSHLIRPKLVARSSHGPAPERKTSPPRGNKQGEKT
ncbi:MAG: LacI family DNA-binding transcriptional regulator [Devosia sp.]